MVKLSNLWPFVSVCGYQEGMAELVKEERERNQACVQEAVEAVKADMRVYTHERHQVNLS